MPGSVTWKGQLRKYRRDVVLRALTQHQSHGPPLRPLPWGWIAAQGGRSFTRRSFSAWWHLRTFGKLVHFVPKGVHCDTCSLCGSVTPELRKHLEDECPVFQLRSQVEGRNAGRCFASPWAPEEFQLVLAVVDELGA